MNDILKHFQTLPRRTLQAELRRITEDPEFYLWEFIGLNWMYTPVSAGPQTAARLGVKRGAIIGYHVAAGHVFGGAISDLMNVAATEPPYPDPFSPA